MSLLHLLKPRETSYLPTAVRIVRNDFKNLRPRDIVATYRGLSLTKYDCLRLVTNNLINDQIINYYSMLIMKRNLAENLPSLYIFETFFFSKLVTNGWEQALTQPAIHVVFSHNLVFLPIHVQDNHWALIVINNLNRSITVFDSLGGKADYLAPVCYFLDGLIAKYELQNKIPFYTLGIATNIPMQANAYDCGVFTMLYAEFLSRNCPFTFTQRDIPFYRQKIFIEILRRDIMNDNEYIRQ